MSRTTHLWTVSALSIGAALPGVLLFRPGVMYALIIVGAIAGLLAVDWREAGSQLRNVAQSPIAWLGAAMLLAFLVSAALGINPENSLGKWIELVGAGVIAILMAVILQQMPVPQLNLLAKTLVFATISMMLLALVDILAGREAFSNAYLGLIRGYAARLQFFSSALTVLLPLVIAALPLTVVDRDKRRLLTLAAAGAGIITVIACGGRSGWAGTLVALVVYVVGLMLLDKLKLRLWHIAFAALIIALGIGLYWQSYGTSFLQQRMMVAQEGIGPMSGRLVLWKVGIDHLGDSPWLGIGLTNYKDLPEATFRHPHNWALQLALETGAIGITLFCAFIGAILWTMLQTARTNRFGLASIASIIGFLVAGLANTSIVNMWWLTFFMLSALIGYALSLRTSNPYSSTVEAPRAA